LRCDKLIRKDFDEKGEDRWYKDNSFSNSGTRIENKMIMRVGKLIYFSEELNFEVLNDNRKGD
jgi:hypothetical protein